MGPLTPGVADPYGSAVAVMASRWYAAAFTHERPARSKQPALRGAEALLPQLLLHPLVSVEAQLDRVSADVEKSPPPLRAGTGVASASPSATARAG